MSMMKILKKKKENNKILTEILIKIIKKIISIMTIDTITIIMDIMKVIKDIINKIIIMYQIKDTIKIIIKMTMDIKNMRNILIIITILIITINKKYKERYNNSSIKKENVKIIKDIPIVNDNKNEHNTKVEFENKNLNENLNKVEVNNVECLSNNEYHQAVDGNIRCDNDNNDILSENVKANVEEFTNTIDNLVNEPLPIKLVNEEDLAANSESLDSLIVSLILLRQQIKTYLK